LESSSALIFNGPVRTFLLTLAALFAFAVSDFAAGISANLAANHIGQTVTITGTVTQVVVTRQSNVSLNFGGAYPHHLFSAVVSKRRTPALLTDGNQWLKDLEGKQVSVTGEIKVYGGKPQIVIRDRSDLHIPRADKDSDKAKEPDKAK